jgi:hypothetical protein
VTALADQMRMYAAKQCLMVAASAGRPDCENGKPEFTMLE